MFARYVFQEIIKESFLKVRTMSHGKTKGNPAKSQLRADISARLAALSPEEKRRQSEIICNKVIKHPWYSSSQRIALFMSTDTEVDTALILDHAHARGAVPFVPQYAGGNMKMLRVLRGDAAKMCLTKHGIAQHDADEVREDAVETGGLELIVTPGLGFTKSGHRLGHGGGYYDRYLTDLLTRHKADPEGFLEPKIMAIAFNEQIYEELVVDEHDILVHEVVTAD